MIDGVIVILVFLVGGFYDWISMDLFFGNTINGSFVF